MNRDRGWRRQQEERARRKKRAKRRKREQDDKTTWLKHCQNWEVGEVLAWWEQLEEDSEAEG